MVFKFEKKSIYLNVTVGVILLSMVSVLHAQQQRQINSINFDHVTNSEGLMHNSIDPIYQDSRGYMWLGTVNGLYKYNGFRYKIYNNELGNQNSIIGNKITAIIEDNELIKIDNGINTCKYLCILNGKFKNLIDVIS